MMMGLSDGSGILMPIHLNYAAALSAEMAAAAGGGGSPQVRGKEERLPQWSQQETRDFIAIRGELERDFTVSKRNKTLWEMVTSRMKERGYRRSPDQCKCKWKNLVNRYKGKETSDPDNGKQCPFFEELHAIFTERARNMHQLLLDSETSTHNHPKKKLKKSNGDKSSDALSDEDEEDEESIDEQRLLNCRKKMEKSKAPNNSIHELLKDFFQQLHRNEAKWRDSIERRTQERVIYEQEWRKSMEKFERERLMMEQAWQEREEQRRSREESRSIKRDALLSTLIDKLVHEDL